MVPGNTFTAKFWPFQSKLRACRSRIWTTGGITPWIFITPFVPVLKFGDLKRLMRQFHKGFKLSSLIKFGPATVLTKHVVGCSTVVVGPTPIGRCTSVLWDIPLLPLVFQTVRHCVQWWTHHFSRLRLRSRNVFDALGDLLLWSHGTRPLASLINEALCNFLFVIKRNLFSTYSSFSDPRRSVL